MEYNSYDSSWSLWAPLAEGVFGHSCALLFDDVVLVGGIDPKNPETLAKSTTTLLNIKTRQERPGGDMLTASIWFGLVMLDNQLMALGGSDRSFEETVNVVLFSEAWDVETETWAATDNKMTTRRASFGHATIPLDTVCP